jgi:hypothetical protein
MDAAGEGGCKGREPYHGSKYGPADLAGQREKQGGLEPDPPPAYRAAPRKESGAKLKRCGRLASAVQDPER